MPEIYEHLSRKGMMRDCTIWVEHGEISDIPTWSEQRQTYLQNLASSSVSVDPAMNLTMDMLGRCFSFL